jgi:Mg2+-importing ATPase
VLLEATDFLVTESSLTGEAFPVEKRVGVSRPDAALAQRTNCAYAGTSVRSGTATVLVVATGRSTSFGAIAERLRRRAPETEFARGIRGFGYLLLSIMVVMVLFVLAVNIVAGRPTIVSLLFAIALAVGLSPELLPAIVSVTLSAGARTLARRGVIVRRLEAIENLGSMDVLCTDKTGTLTEGVIALTAALDAYGLPNEAVRHLAFLNASFESGIENPLDQAIMRDGTDRALTIEGFRKVDEIPYDFSRKRLSIAVGQTTADPIVLITKGAFDNVLAACSHIRTGEQVVVLLPAEEMRLRAYYETRGSEGFRVLAVATKLAGSQTAFGRADEDGMIFEGFLLFFDAPKASARKAISDLRDRGVAIKIITGDNRHVAAHVASSMGFSVSSLVTGEEVSRLSSEALGHRMDTADVFAEIEPQQKEALVRALQHRGHAVGYMGDGINDAAALHAADVGISVDGAVDVARQSADIILLQQDLDVVRAGVEDGRRTFINTGKYISITTSANFGNMVSMALATPFLPFLPLAAKQILLNNFLTDIPAISISSDSVDEEAVRVPTRWSIDEIRRFMIVFGLTSSLFDAITFFILLAYFHADEAVFQTSWFCVSLLTEIGALIVLRTKRFALSSRPGTALLWTSILIGCVGILAPFVVPVRDAFDFVVIDWRLLALLSLVVPAYLAVTELLKQRFFRSRSLKARS